MNAIIIFTVLLGFAAEATAITTANNCSKIENTNCVHWVKNGFCNNMGYTLAQRQSYCGISCGLCTAAGVPINSTVCEDANANCAAWTRNGFCSSSVYTGIQKTAYCCKSCATPTNPTTDCAVIYQGASATAVVNTGTTTQVQLITATQPLSKVFVKTGCSLKLMGPDPVTEANGSPFPGKNPAAFVDLTGTATQGVGYECTCT